MLPVACPVGAVIVSSNLCRFFTTSPGIPVFPTQICEVSMDDLTARLIKHEGMEQSVYKDSLGYYTIGAGHMIDARLGGKLSISICMAILAEDIAEARAELSLQSFYRYQSTVRQDAIVELCFAMGLGKLLHFVEMIAALKVKDYARAADELLDSEWSRQVGIARANDLAHRIQYGRYL